MTPAAVHVAQLIIFVSALRGSALSPHLLRVSVSPRQYLFILSNSAYTLVSYADDAVFAKNCNVSV